MTKFWCQTCEEFRGNWIDRDGRLRGIECSHLLEDGDEEAAEPVEGPA